MPLCCSFLALAPVRKFIGPNQRSQQSISCRHLEHSTAFFLCVFFLFHLCNSNKKNLKCQLQNVFSSIYTNSKIFALAIIGCEIAFDYAANKNVRQTKWRKWKQSESKREKTMVINQFKNTLVVLFHSHEIKSVSVSAAKLWSAQFSIKFSSHYFSPSNK